MHHFARVASAAVLQLGCGAVLLYDNWERRSAPCPPSTATFFVGASSGLALLMLHLIRPGYDVAIRISALSGLYASIDAGHADSFTSFAADILLRWLLLWLAAGAGSSAAGRAALLAQLGWLYLGSLLYKDFDAYFTDAHAARSLLITEIHDARDWWPWRLAVEVAASPWLGPALSRFAYVAEAGAGLMCAFVSLAAFGALVSHACDAPLAVQGAHAAVRRANAVALPLALLVSGALHVGIALTVHLSFFPYVSLVLTLACWRAAVELEDDLASIMAAGATGAAGTSGAAGATGSHTPTTRPPSLRAMLATATAPLTLALVLALLLALLPVLPLGALHAAVLALRRRLRMHQHWTMFPFESDFAALTSRVTVFVELEDGTEIDLRSYAPGTIDADRSSSSSAPPPRLRTGRPWEDFARAPPVIERTTGVAGGYPSFRWRTFWGHVLNGLDMQDDAYRLSAAIAVRAACEHACILWRETQCEARPPAPVAIRLYGVAHDLPRRRGQNVVEREAKRFANGALDEVKEDGSFARRAAGVTERLMWRAAREEMGVWPRFVVATELSALECSAGCRASQILGEHTGGRCNRLGGEGGGERHPRSPLEALTPTPLLHTTAEAYLSSEAFLSRYYAWIDAPVDAPSSSPYDASAPEASGSDGHSGDRGGSGSDDDIDVRQAAYAYADDGSDVRNMIINRNMTTRRAFPPDAPEPSLQYVATPLTSDDAVDNKWTMRGDAASLREARNLAWAGVPASHASSRAAELESSVTSLGPYEARNVPLTLRLVAASWPGATRWPSIDYIRSVFGEVEWEVEAFGPDNPDHIFTFSDSNFPWVRLASVLDLWEASVSEEQPGGANMVISELDFIVRGEVRTLHSLMTDFPFPFLFDAERHTKSSLFMARSAYTQVRPQACSIWQ